MKNSLSFSWMEIKNGSGNGSMDLCIEGLGKWLPGRDFADLIGDPIIYKQFFLVLIKSYISLRET